MEAGRKEDAFASFDMAASIEPNSTLLFSEMARLHLKVAANQTAERGPSLAHQEPDPSKGGVDTVTETIDRQIDRHRQALKKRPNHADMHYRLGLLLRSRGFKEQAVEEYRHAVEINPVYVKALVKLGLALKEAGEAEEAIVVLERATELKPEYVDLHYHLGLLFAERNRFEVAVEHFEQAGKDKPDDVDFHANLALALQNMGLLDRAAATWQGICELAPFAPTGESKRTA
jgi:tetratricopeptide (TPR) repeat protein